MAFIEIENVSKIYETKDKKKQFALKNVFLHFPDVGLITIIGKSGSGKSTLLNMLALLDKPSEGRIIINNKVVSDFEEKETNDFHKQSIGVVFQHYHLLENETVLFNLMLPSLINGKSKKEAKKRAYELLKSISFDKQLINHKCQDLSGGEKERIAVLRALVNDPPILLADEPTGALDSNNSFKVMEILKKESQNKLVIIVTHNNTLARQFSDRIIEIKDGNIKKDNLINETNNKKHKHKPIKTHHGSSWIEHLSFSNFKRKIRRNFISLLALVIGLFSSLLIIGFSNGYAPSIVKETNKQLDYGSLNISRESITELKDSPLSLVKMTRPSEKEIQNLQKENLDFIFTPNFDYLFPSAIDVIVGEESLDFFNFSPVYSFLDNYVDYSLLLEGKMPKYDSLIEVLINKKASMELEKLFKSSPIGLIFNISLKVETSYSSTDVINPLIYDYFVFSKNIKIVGIVDSLDFLSTPKVYYSYKALIELMEDTKLNNLSNYLKEDISWYQRVSDAYNNEGLSSYSYRLFLKDFSKIELIDSLINKTDNQFKIDCPSITIRNALFDLIKAAKIGMGLFLIIAIIGTGLILGILSFSSYSEDRKTSAILSSLGAEKNDILNIYLYENCLIGFLGVILSFSLACLLKNPINHLIMKITKFSNIIDIPFSIYRGVKFSLPLLLIFGTFIICYVSSYFPINFSKKISIKEELKDE